MLLSFLFKNTCLLLILGYISLLQFQLLNMKQLQRFALPCLLLFLGTAVQAQDATTAAGGDVTGSGGSVAYSVGQVAYTSVESASGSVNQGVQQPYEVTVTGINSRPDINLSLSVYPNPSASFINLNVGNQKLDLLSFQLYDVTGKILMNQKVTATETTIRMEAFAKGNYFLKVLENKSEVKTFKIIKN